MQEMDVDNDTERAEVLELVTVGTSGKMMQSFADASLGAALKPTALIKMGHHMRLLHGRYFFLKSSHLTNEYLDSHSYEEVLNDGELKNAVISYHSYVNAHLIKKSLRMHPFFSNYSAGILKRKRKNHEILKSLESVFETADTLSESVKKQKELFNDRLERNLSHSERHNAFLQDIEDHRATLQQQHVDREAKEEVALKKREVKFLAEFCSRLLAITPIYGDLIDVLFDVTDVLDQVP